MITTLLIASFLFVIVPIYTIWRSRVAFFEREKATLEINEKLKTADIPESLEVILSRAHGDCTKSYISWVSTLQVVSWFLFPSLQKHTDMAEKEVINQRVEDYKKLSKEERTVFIQALTRFLLINISLSPISYVLITITLILLFVLPVLIFSKFKNMDSIKVRIQEYLFTHA